MERYQESIVDFEEDVNPSHDLIGLYYAQKMKAASLGEAVWIRRDFDTDSGRVLDFFNRGRMVGFIEEEYGYGCDVYVIDYENDMIKNTIWMNSPERPLNIEEAKRLLLALDADHKLKNLPSEDVLDLVIEMRPSLGLVNEMLNQHLTPKEAILWWNRVSEELGRMSPVEAWTMGRYDEVLMHARSSVVK